MWDCKTKKNLSLNWIPIVILYHCSFPGLCFASLGLRFSDFLGARWAPKECKITLVCLVWQWKGWVGVNTFQHTSPISEADQDRCSCEIRNSIPFLDTSCSIENGLVDTDLYKKPTDRNQYLLPTSCHPRATTKSIPFSLGLRIVRICRKPENRDKRLQELKLLLLERNYPEKLVQDAISKARKVPLLSSYPFHLGSTL